MFNSELENSTVTTKMVFKLSGQLTYEYQGIVEVIGDPPESEINRLTRYIPSHVDGQEYTADPMSWTPSDSCIERATQDSDQPSLCATWNGDGWEFERLFRSDGDHQLTAGCDLNSFSTSAADRISRFSNL